MKKLFLAAAIIGMTTFGHANAQLRVNLNLNVGSQPEWGPTGYDHADYYYMPDIGTYYDVNAHQYVYRNGSNWVRSTALPQRYNNYDVYHGYKVVINQQQPYLHDDVYRQKYAQYKGQRNQTIIRDSHDDKYKNHYREDGRRGDNRGDNNRGNDNRDDHNRGNDHRGDNREGHQGDDHRDHGDH